MSLLFYQLLSLFVCGQAFAYYASSMFFK